MRSHASGLSLAASARTDRKIVLALDNRRDETRDQFRAIAAVAVEKHDDVVILGGLGASPAGPPVAALAQDYHVGAGRLRPLDGAISARTVDDDNLIDDVTRHGGDHTSDRLLLVEGGDDEGDALLRHQSQTPAKSATCAGARRFITQQSGTECLIARAVPNLPQALLSRVSQGEAVITAHRERRDAAWNCPSMRGEIHQGPRAPAQRPWARHILRREAAGGVGRSRGIEADPQLASERFRLPHQPAF